MFKLVYVQREVDSPPNPGECQVLGYKGNWLVDTYYFPNTTDCIRWAAANVDWATKFEIYNDDLPVKIMGVVGETKVITWGDYPLN